MNIALPIAMLIGLESLVGPPPPTPEIKALIVQLGDDNFRTRENASKKLAEEGYKAIGGLYEAIRTSESPEVHARAQRVVGRYFGVYCNKKDLPTMPSIWLLEDKQRFPRGVKIEKDDDDPKGDKNHETTGRYVSSAGWCKTMEGYDLAAYYYEKARKRHNEQLRKEELERGWKLSDDTWINDYVEREAMRMYLYDKLYRGEKREDVQKLVDAIAERSKTHENLHRHYGGGSLGSVIPGPAVPKEEIPAGSEYRFHGWGCLPCLFGRPGLALRFCMVP